MSIVVCPLSRVSEVAADWKPTRAISILDPESAFPEVRGVPARRHLRLAFHDAHLTGFGLTVPTSEHIGQLLAFVEQGTPADRLLIHCRAGIGRSTATAFVVACYQFRDVSETEIAWALRKSAPFARPNRILVNLADTAMARGGRMWPAMEETERRLIWPDVSEGEPFELSIRANGQGRVAGA